MNLRRRVATCLDEVARVAGKLADRLDPPGRVIERARSPFLSEAMREAVRTDLQQRAERLRSQLRHPAYAERPQTILGVVEAEEGPVAEVVPLREVVSAEELDGDGWVPCSLGTITATRPIGAQVRLLSENRRVEHVGRIVGLTPSSRAFVRYVLTIEEPDGRTVLDLPLSHPLEVNRDRV